MSTKYTKPPQHWGEDDNTPPLRGTISFPPGTSANILVGATVTIDIWDPVTGAMIETDRSCTIIDAAAFRIQYDPQAADTANGGDFHARLHGLTSDGKRFTVPNDDSVMLIKVAPAHD